MNSFGQLTLAGFFVGLVLAFCHGYTAHTTEFTGFTLVNRTMSSATIFLLGLVLVLGPLVRVFGGAWKTLFMLRKEIGMYAFLTASMHGYLSWFTRVSPWSTIPALVAFWTMAALFLFSFAKLQKHLDPALWWRLQYMGARVALVSIVVHTIVLRFDSWIIWMTGWAKGEQLYPPLALLAFLFSAYVIAVKVFERNLAQKDLLLRVTTFVWFVLIEILFILPRIR